MDLRPFMASSVGTAGPVGEGKDSASSAASSAGEGRSSASSAAASTSPTDAPPADSVVVSSLSSRMAKWPERLRGGTEVSEQRGLRATPPEESPTSVNTFGATANWTSPLLDQLQDESARVSLDVALSVTPGAAPTGTVLLPDGSCVPYPKARKTNHVDKYKGIKVHDPYRPLEKMQSEPTREWVADENRLTKRFLSKVEARAEIHEAVEKALDVRWRVLPKVAGDQLFFSKRVGENQPVICTSGLDGRGEKVVLDPNPLAADGTVAVSGWEVSPDGRHLAYALARSGSDWVEWHVRDLQTGDDTSDRIRWTKFPDLSWADDGQGFWYEAFERPPHGEELTAPNQGLGPRFHRLGTHQSEDLAEGAEGAPARPPAPRTDDDGNDWTPIGKNDTTEYFMVKGPTHPRGCIMGASVDGKGEEQVIVGDRKDTLQEVLLTGGQLITHYLHDAHSKIVRFDSQGTRLGEIPVPDPCTVEGFRETPDGHVLYSIFSPSTPRTVYRYDVAGDRAEILFKPQTPFNPDDYQTRLEFCESKDGTRVPVFITHRKDVPLDGKRPTYLYAYGGFNVNETPSFDPGMIPWMDMGGVYVTASLRGGGEYGNEWHEAGQGLNKQNVFDDFIAAGEMLVEQGVTRPDRLAIGGGSNGGLLVAAVELQRPDLFGAAIPEVGVMDMMRFPRWTSGQYWVGEYGSMEKRADIRNMLEYSPLHCVQQGKPYPATMVMTSDHDDRVVPAHSYKLAAELQQAQGGDDPILLRTERKAGHGAGLPLSKAVGAITDRLTFMWEALNMGEEPETPTGQKA